MARTPVVAEKKNGLRTLVVKTEENTRKALAILKNAGRMGPAVVVREPVPDAPTLPTDEELDVAVARVAKTPVPPLDEDGHRVCAYEDCGASFKPKSMNPKDDDVTEFYCTSAHATAAYYKRHGLGTVPEKIVHGVEGATRSAAKQEKIRARAENEPIKEAKYGPKRTIIEVLRQEGKKLIVKLSECGHERKVSPGRKSVRCRKCRTGQPARVEVATTKPKRTPVVEEKKSKRTPVKAEKSKRTPVKAEKSKRQPVKPPKRGKKGKR